jgi:hypothetical protein
VAGEPRVHPIGNYIKEAKAKGHWDLLFFGLVVFILSLWGMGARRGLSFLVDPLLVWLAQARTESGWTGC